MARVPEYTRVVYLDRANAGNIEAAGAAAGGNAARGFQADANRYERNAQQGAQLNREIAAQKRADRQISTREKFNEFERGLTSQYQEQRNARMTKPDGFAKDFDTQFMNQQEELENQLGEGGGIDLPLFRQLADEKRTSIFQSSTDWENGMRVQNVATGVEQNIDGMNVNFSLGSPTMGDLSKQLQKTKDYVNETGAKVLNPENQLRLFKYGADQATRVVMDSMLEKDPRSLNRVMNYGAGGKNNVIDFVMQEIEGGDKVVSDGDGIAKYGINSAANKDVDVKNLSADGAREIYASKYWDAKLDKFDPAFQVVAFDALVNHGNDKDTWKMIADAKGDPYALIAARQAEYSRLATENPEKYAKNSAGWDRRLREVSAYAQNLEAGGKDLIDHAALLDPEIVNRTKAALPGAIAAKEREEEAMRKQRLSDYSARYKETYDTMTTALEPVGVEELNQLSDLAQASGDAEAIAQAQAMYDLRTYVNQLKGMPEASLKTVIRQQSAAVNKEPNAHNRFMLKVAETVLDKQVAGAEKEGLGYYARINEIRAPQPLDYQNPEAAVSELRRREMDATQVQEKTGKLYPVLMPEEVTEIKDAITAMPANVAAQFVGYFDTLTPQSKATLAKSIDDKDPVLATAIQVEDVETRRRLLAGARIDPKYKPAEMDAAVTAVLDPMVSDPQFISNANKAVAAHYNAMAQNERDFSDVINPERVRKSIEAVYGPIVDLSFAGTEHVFNFKDPETNKYVDEDEVYNMFNGMTDDQLKKLNGGELPKGAFGETITAKDIRSGGRVVSTGDGLYGITFDDAGALRGKGDKPVELDGRQLLTLYRKEKKKPNAEGRTVAPGSSSGGEDDRRPAAAAPSPSIARGS